jgi:hypothetical protein
VSLLDIKHVQRVDLIHPSPHPRLRVTPAQATARLNSSEMAGTTATTSGLYVPVHRRSPSSASHRSDTRECLRHGCPIHANRILAARGIYSVAELLNLSSSPLAHLSREQERQVRDHLYLASSWKQPGKARPVLKVPIPPAGSNIGSIGAAQPPVSRREVNVADPERKRKGWGYSLHPSALQSDWRGIRLPVVTLGV